MVVPKLPKISSQQQHKHQHDTVPSSTSSTSTSSSFISSYYVSLIVKILLILIILFTLPKLVTGTLTTTKDRRQQNMNMKSKQQQQHRRYQHHIYKRYKYKLRSLRNTCQNTNYNNSKCNELIPEESLNCVNQCISISCYIQIYNSTSWVTINNDHDDTLNNHDTYHYDYDSSVTSSLIYDIDSLSNSSIVDKNNTTTINGTTTTTMLVHRVPLEDGEIDIIRAKEFEHCVIEELRNNYDSIKQQQKLQQQRRT